MFRVSLGAKAIDREAPTIAKDAMAVEVAAVSGNAVPLAPVHPATGAHPAPGALPAPGARSYPPQKIPSGGECEPWSARTGTHGVSRLVRPGHSSGPRGVSQGRAVQGFAAVLRIGTAFAVEDLGTPLTWTEWFRAGPNEERAR